MTQQTQQTQHQTDPEDPLAILAQDRVLCIVRAPRVADAAGLAAALVGAGLRAVEFTFTIPGVLDAITKAAQVPGAFVGAGTVLTADQARAAVDAGARYLVTPDLRPEVAETGNRAGVPVILGAFTATEVGRAADLGAAAIKIFPARTGGPDHLRDLHGPFPRLRFVATGGIGAQNARSFLDAGAIAVGAGSDVVTAGLVADGDHAAIAERAAALRRALEQSG
ncbi:MAG TPA: bifunctional 4-hydroxy-2-oxoglutarate aldolase/2-dehydro-3-deoxy-phosphogluconate aldolase [Actinocrinis sp.]|jgi:2-dehydro-3-deoxyphosphogluconate aldolase/(4S)-4-hydroxy-2-oxoglutarate aldolase